MVDPAAEFERELEVFGGEVEEAIQCFHVWLTVHAVARKSKKVYSLLDRHAAFWNTTLRALQANALIVLGRIFDRDKRSHTVDRLLHLAATNPGIFSASALRRRKTQRSAKASEWLDDYMRDVHVPTASDFSRWRRYVDVRRRLYERSYKDVRNKVFAHKSRIDVSSFLAKANVRQLGRLLASLERLHDVLWNLLHNGKKPNFRLVSQSARRQAARETHKFLESLFDTCE